VTVPNLFIYVKDARNMPYAGLFQQAFFTM